MHGFQITAFMRTRRNTVRLISQSKVQLVTPFRASLWRRLSFRT
eukprot:COSAG05_NODE_579_length_8556_cov_44.773679_5_plen_44_part_00